MSEQKTPPIMLPIDTKLKKISIRKHNRYVKDLKSKYIMPYPELAPAYQQLDNIKLQN